MPTELATGLYATGREIFYDRRRPLRQDARRVADALSAGRPGSDWSPLRAHASRPTTRATRCARPSPRTCTQAEAVRYALAGSIHGCARRTSGLRSRGGTGPTRRRCAGGCVSREIELAGIVARLRGVRARLRYLQQWRRILFIPQRDARQPQARRGASAAQPRAARE